MKLYSANTKGELIELDKLNFSKEEVYLVDDITTIYLWIGNDVNLDQQDNTVRKARELNKERGGSAKLLLLHQNKEYGSFSAMMDQLKEGFKESESIERRPELKLEEPKEVIKAIEEKAPEVEKGVIQWLEQLKKYRKWEPSEVPKEEVVKDVSAETEQVIEREPKKEFITEEKPEEITEEKTHLEKWLEQLKTYRTEVVIKEKAKEIEEKPIIKEEVIEEEKEKVEVDFETLVRVGAYYLSRKGYAYDELCWLLAEKTLNIKKGKENVTENDIKEQAEEIFNTSCTYDELCWLISEMDTLVSQKYLDEF